MKRLLALLVLAVLGGCQLKSADVAEVELASEPEGEMAVPLSASFLSEGQTFTYTLHYDGDLMQIVDGQFEGAEVVGPSFEVSGGAQIVVRTGAVAEVEALKGNGTVETIQEREVYRVESNQDGCAVSEAALPVATEALFFTLKSCAGSDAAMGAAALEDLLRGLELGTL